MIEALIIVFMMFVVVAWAWHRVRHGNEDLERRVGRLQEENEQLSRDLSEARRTRDLGDRHDAACHAVNEDADEDDWPDEWELWRDYISARLAACGLGCSDDDCLRDVSEDHVAYTAAQALGQAEGARLKSHPDERVALLSVAELNEQLEDLLGVNESPSAVEGSKVLAAIRTLHAKYASTSAEAAYALDDALGVLEHLLTTEPAASAETREDDVKTLTIGDLRLWLATIHASRDDLEVVLRISDNEEGETTVCGLHVIAIDAGCTETDALVLDGFLDEDG